jgi:hypothetical protein
MGMVLEKYVTNTSGPVITITISNVVNQVSRTVIIIGIISTRPRRNILKRPVQSKKRARPPSPRVPSRASLHAETRVVLFVRRPPLPVQQPLITWRSKEEIRSTICDMSSRAPLEDWYWIVW